MNVDMDDKPKTRILRNGAIYDNETKRIVGMDKSKAQVNTLITSDNAVDMVARRVERKREIIAAAANEAVERDDYRLRYGSDAWIAAIADAQYIKATTPDDPKSTDAARFLLAEAGLADKQSLTQSDAPQLASILGSVAAAAVEAAIRAGRMDAIDADVIPIRQDDND